MLKEYRGHQLYLLEMYMYINVEKLNSKFVSD